MAYSNKISQVITRNQELEDELAETNEQFEYSNKEKENLEARVMDQQLEIGNHSSVNMRLAKTEQDLRLKIESSKARLINQEETIRNVSEENYSLRSEIQNLQTDVVNMVNVESSLRQELESMSYRNHELEDGVSQLKAKI